MLFVCLFDFSFSISKERVVVNSDFPAGWGKGNFYVCERMAHPSHLRRALPRNTCLLHLKSVQTTFPDQELLFQCPASLQYLFPTCLMPLIAWECSSQGKMCLGPDMAKLPAANVHPESGSRGAWVQKCSSFSLVGLEKAFKRRR